MTNAAATETFTRHYHCGFDCYRQHRNGLGTCTNVGHYDHPEMCIEDCTDHCKDKRQTLGI
jgi:hypothetical protein